MGLNPIFELQMFHSFLF